MISTCVLPSCSKKTGITTGTNPQPDTPAVPTINNTMYIGDSAGYFYAIDLSTHAIKWKYYDYASGYGFNAINNPAAVSNGTLYTSGWNGLGYWAQITALDALTGTAKWSLGDSRRIWCSTPPVIDNGILYGSGSYYESSLDFENIIFALDISNGNIIWKFNTGTSEGARPSSVTVVDGTVYCAGGYVPKLFALNASTGSLVWQANLHITCYDNPVWVNGTIVVSAAPGNLYGIDAGTGQINWTRSMGFQTGFSSIARYENAVAICGDSTLAIVDAASGTVDTTFKANEELGASPAISNNVIYCTGSKNLYALSLPAMQLLWQKPVATYSCSPVVCGSAVYITGKGDNKVRVLDAATGEELWHISLSASMGWSPLVIDAGGETHYSSDNGKNN